MGFVTVECKCIWCGGINYVQCDKTAWGKYEAGALIQDAFPDMDIVEREMIISGTCPACQEKFMSEDDYFDDCGGECDICCDFDCPSNPYFSMEEEEE